MVTFVIYSIINPANMVIFTHLTVSIDRVSLRRKLHYFNRIFTWGRHHQFVIQGPVSLHAFDTDILNGMVFSWNNQTLIEVMAGALHVLVYLFPLSTLKPWVRRQDVMYVGTVISRKQIFSGVFRWRVGTQKMFNRMPLIAVNSRHSLYPWHC